MEDNKTLREEIQELKDLVVAEKKVKIKPFKIPFRGRVNKKKARDGWVTIQKINDNRRVTWERQKIEEQTIIVDGVPRVLTADEVLFDHKGSPLVILPSWSVKPFSPTDNYSGTIQDGYATQGYRLLMNRMKNEIITAKKKMSGMMIFGGLILLVAIGYFMVKGGVFK